MLSWKDFCLLSGVLGVVCAVGNAVPLPADQDDTKVAIEPAKLPFSLELEPPLPDSNGAGKPVVLPLRDSYGNPILPSVLGVDPSGVDYDLGARPNIDGPSKTVFTQGINFPIPSYASGITEIHRPSDGLLPPFANDKTPNAEQTPNAASAPSSIPSLVTDLLPPLSVPLSKDESLNEISGPDQQRENEDSLATTTTSTTIAPDTATITRNTAISTNPLTATKDQSKIPFPTTLPLEILIKGEKSESRPISAVPTLSTILLPPRISSNSRPFQVSPTPLTTQSPPLLRPDSVLPPSGRSIQQNSFQSISFGFANIPTNESPKSTIIGQTLQERFGSNSNAGQLPTFINSLQPPPNQPQPPPSFFVSVPASGIPTQPAIVTAPVTSGPLADQPKPDATTVKPGKYTGGFGGAPGVLGEQKEVGFLVKPQQEGTAAAAASPAPASPASPVLPPVQVAPPAPVAQPTPVAAAVASAPAAPVSSPSGGSKYTGGFGGPPGFLVPFDNDKKDA